MEKIRIAFVISSLEIGGAERVFLNLVQALDDKKYIKKVFIFKKNYNTPFDLELQKSGIDYVYINKKLDYFSICLPIVDYLKNYVSFLLILFIVT